MLEGNEPRLEKNAECGDFTLIEDHQGSLQGMELVLDHLFHAVFIRKSSFVCGIEPFKGETRRSQASGV